MVASAVVMVAAAALLPSRRRCLHRRQRGMRLFLFMFLILLLLLLLLLLIRLLLQPMRLHRHLLVLGQGPTRLPDCQAIGLLQRIHRRLALRLVVEVVVLVIEMVPPDLSLQALGPALTLLLLLLRRLLGLLLLLQPQRLCMRMLVLVLLLLVLVQCPTLVPDLQTPSLLQSMRWRPVQLLVQVLAISPRGMRVRHVHCTQHGNVIGMGPHQRKVNNQRVSRSSRRQSNFLSFGTFQISITKLASITRT
jgi:hypothetical protein